MFMVALKGWLTSAGGLAKALALPPILLPLCLWTTSTILVYSAPKSVAGEQGDPKPIEQREKKAKSRHLETYNGVSATENSWFSYFGAAYAPFTSIDKPGFRLRALGGYGEYSYSSSLSDGIEIVSQNFLGETSLGEVMIGYAFHADPLYAKAYIGAAYQSHTLSPQDSDNAVQGEKWGIKGQVELWLNLGNDAWGSADASYTSVFDSYAASTKLGYKILPSVSLGLEAGAFGNETYNAVKLGGFARYHHTRGDMTLSIGASGDYEEPSGLYGALSFSRKF